MSAHSHRADAPSSVACAVLTVSDSRTVDTDTSGRAIVELLEAAGHLIVRRELVRDEPADVAAFVMREIKGRAEVVITTGGTGISARDSTYETLSGLIDKPLPGFGELFRFLSFEEVGAAAMLSRAMAGVAGKCAIFVLPGSESAVRLAMTRLILPELGHIARELAR
jgi:molybdenum cofactor biosynthesis protein B